MFPWLGKRLPWGDRYDAFALPVGLGAFLLLGFLVADPSHKPLAGWLISFGIGAGVMNVVSFILRRVAGVENRSVLAGRRGRGDSASRRSQRNEDLEGKS